MSEKMYVSNQQEISCRKKCRLQHSILGLIFKINLFRYTSAPMLAQNLTANHLTFFFHFEKCSILYFTLLLTHKRSMQFMFKETDMITP